MNGFYRDVSSQQMFVNDKQSRLRHEAAEARVLKGDTLPEARTPRFSSVRRGLAGLVAQAQAHVHPTQGPTLAANSGH
jgi:hypothetical protein